MIQTLVAAILFLADAALIQFNLSTLGIRLALAAPGVQSVAVTGTLLMAAAAGAVALVWLAGQGDHALVRRQLARRDTTLHMLSEELLRMKVSALGSQESVQSAVRTRLDALDRDLRALRTHVDEALAAERTTGFHSAITDPTGSAGPAHDPVAAPWT